MGAGMCLLSSESGDEGRNSSGSQGVPGIHLPAPALSEGLGSGFDQTGRVWAHAGAFKD